MSGRRGGECEGRRLACANKTCVARKRKRERRAKWNYKFAGKQAGEIVSVLRRSDGSSCARVRLALCLGGGGLLAAVSVASAAGGGARDVYARRPRARI